jgi:hypothetical protein
LALQAKTVPVLDDSDAYQGLTSAQHRFVTASISGLNDTEAYRMAFRPVGMSDTALWQAAHTVSQLPQVKAKITELRQKAEAQATLAPNLTREFVTNGIMGLALNATKESVQLGAYIALGKTVGIDLFRDVHVTERVTRTAEDVDKELKARLLELQRTLTIEGEARPAEPAPDTRRDRRRKPAS